MHGQKAFIMTRNVTYVALTSNGFFSTTNKKQVLSAMIYIMLK